MAYFHAKSLLAAFAVSAGLSVFTSTYERSITPLFASVPTGKYLPHVLYGTVALTFIVPRLTTSRASIALAVFCLLAPITSYRLGAYAARFRDPIKGPLTTHVMVLAPVVFAGASIIRNHVEFFVLGSIHSITWAYMRLKESTVMKSGKGKISSVLFRVIAPAVLLPLLFLIVPSLRSPTLPHPLVGQYSSPSYPLRILSSIHSITGIVVVGELLPPPPSQDITSAHSFRFLRASHSLLGGVWIGSKVMTMNDALPMVDEQGTPLGDSIYSAFVLQEAARLVDSAPHIQTRENALIIGLGAGISASAFTRHNMSTTVVEIDPAVYDASRRFFGLPDLGQDRVFLEDARKWVKNRKSSIDWSSSPTMYDIIVHDCFSGGGVPGHIFTLEFWEDLKTIMSPEGVLAVNFAGKLGSDASRAVLVTLKKAFRQCRAFHDALEHMSDEQLRAEFINMVFFCSMSPRPLNFRPAVEGDFLNSYMRRHILSSLPEREVNLTQITGSLAPASEDLYVLTDKRNMLDEWQHDEALEHWKLMREVLPDIVWETY
ncbi:hypothetical protein SERLADRAFT_367251 [Serpula lacrymans var. lacrymans S7.9]|uniref:PABS domain-containing protein n=1 Tax=Serpula lacrymans var. lacrymans (strain S7.9) TaxID=578457 RepID=F8NPB8_SERL9|nr:uncharacterized protein SERLADRAFT_367251 [Serpula lacrymans var. lacrymans S7.9]EGO27683.1 hypothetical protein SERLADRAFT_367251 [Serpula lacrymans var. lacrymans S7.9]